MEAVDTSDCGMSTLCDFHQDCSGIDYGEPNNPYDLALLAAHHSDFLDTLLVHFNIIHFFSEKGRTVVPQRKWE